MVGQARVEIVAMGRFTEQQEKVAHYYNEIIFEAESVRLLKDSPVEFAMTGRYLKRWIPAGARVAEIGVGTGHYSELLARHGCSIHLVDIAERLLEAATDKLRRAGLQEQIIGVSRASATELDCLDSGAFDAVLLLGPLYHLCSLEERQRAVKEAARVLKPNGLLFAAGINRLTYLRDLFRNSPNQASARKAFHARYLQDGNLDPEHAPPIGYAHLTTVAEFKKLFDSEFEEIMLAAVESFAGIAQTKLANLPETEVEAWLDLIEQTATLPEAFGLADHYLYLGRKLAEQSLK